MGGLAECCSCVGRNDEEKSENSPPRNGSNEKPTMPIAII